MSITAWPETRSWACSPALGGVGEAYVAEVERIVRLYLIEKDSLEPVPARELLERARKGLVTVLDVRPPEEFAAGHLPGAVNIPVHELEKRLGRAAEAQGSGRLLPRTVLLDVLRRGPASPEEGSQSEATAERTTRMAARRATSDALTFGSRRSPRSRWIQRTAPGTVRGAERLSLRPAQDDGVRAEPVSDPARVGVDAAGEVVEAADHLDAQARGAELGHVVVLHHRADHALSPELRVGARLIRDGRR